MLKDTPVVETNEIAEGTAKLSLDPGLILIHRLCGQDTRAQPN